MKKMFMFLVVVMWCVGAVEAGILNTVGVNDIVEVINKSEPSIAWGHDFGSDEGVTTATVSLLTYSNRDFALGSLRFGYAGDEIDQPHSVIGGIEFIMPNLVRRFIPEKFKDWQANLKVLSLIPSFSAIGGYSVKEEDLDEGNRWVYGFTFGPKITF